MTYSLEFLALLGRCVWSKLLYSVHMESKVLNAEPGCCSWGGGRNWGLRVGDPSSSAAPSDWGQQQEFSHPSLDQRGHEHRGEPSGGRPRGRWEESPPTDHRALYGAMPYAPAEDWRQGGRTEGRPQPGNAFEGRWFMRESSGNRLTPGLEQGAWSEGRSGRQAQEEPDNHATLKARMAQVRLHDGQRCYSAVQGVVKAAQ